MSNIHTLTSIKSTSTKSDWKNNKGYRLQENMETDTPDCGNTSRDTNNPTDIIPSKLSTNDICMLFEDYLENVEEKDRKDCIEKMKNEKIDGKTLVKACEDNKLMDRVQKALGFPLGLSLRFEEMMALIKRRQKELQEDNDKNQAVPTVSTNDQTAPKGVLQNINNADCVIGSMINHGQHQEIITGCTINGKEKNN